MARGWINAPVTRCFSRIQLGMKLDQARLVIRTLEDGQKRESILRKRCQWLASMSLALYAEMDKVLRRDPLALVDDVALRPVNELIAYAAPILRMDRVLRALQPFDPRRGCPEYRDVVCVLRQVRAGLECFSESLDARRSQLATCLAQAKTIEAALVIAGRKGCELVERQEIEAEGVAAHQAWLVDCNQNWCRFDFEKLANTDLIPFFSKGL